MYWANIFLARHLNIDAFDDYSVAVSVVTLLSTLSTLGLEKYALRSASLNIERENWGRLRNFLQFSVRTILLFSLLLMLVLSLGLESVLAWYGADYHIAIVVYAGFLPVIAVSLFFIEIVTVFGHQILAMVLYRLFLPATFIALVYAVPHFVKVSAVSAVLSLGAAWCLTLLTLLLGMHVTRPKALASQRSNSQNKRKWLGKALPLLISSLMMTTLTSAGTIILEIQHPSGFEVGLFAVVMQTCALVSLIATSTNRYYLPMLVVLIERRDSIGIKRLQRQRLRLVGLLLVLYLSIIMAFGMEILALFGPGFEQGYLALCCCAMGATMSTLFSDSPYYLQFMGQNRLVIGLMAGAAISMLSLGFWLGQQYGAIGVAIAYAAPTALLFCCLKWQANRLMRRYLAVSVPN